MSGAAIYMDGQLEDELVSALEPRLRDALNHPVRRGILRVLHGKGQPCGLSVILSGLRLVARSEVSYHLQVLQTTGAVVFRGSRPAPSNGASLYQSSLTDNPAVLSILGATELPDRRHRQRAKRDKPSNLLKMFRIPRPEHAIRLSMRGDRKSKPAE